MLLDLGMDIVEINKALSNHTRVQILEWLKDPAWNFPPHKELGHFDFGVCQDYIREKAGLSQSTISQYMAQLQKAGLVKSTRAGKWTYFMRDEQNINLYIDYLAQNL